MDLDKDSFETDDNEDENSITFEASGNGRSVFIHGYWSIGGNITNIRIVPDDCLILFNGNLYDNDTLRKQLKAEYN